MLIKRATLDAIRDGEISLQFRRWKRPTVKAGGRLRTAIGELTIDAVDVVSETAITAAEAKRAGYASRAALLEELARHGEALIHRVALRFAGADPREALRHASRLDGDDLAEIARRLARFDGASRRGAWTADVLELISRRPATRAADLAAELGHETKWLKGNVRKLKELGLTESLEIGYRIAPRGRAWLDTKRGPA